MPIQIGAKLPGDFSTPLELLSDCHRRIERFLAVLRTIAAQAHAREMTDEERRQWQQALDYFRNAAPRHTADEEESLFPRLRRMRRTDVTSALTEMSALEDDHRLAAEWHETVERTGRAWLANGRLDRADAERLNQALARLSELYQQHIAIEEQQIFPLAAAALSTADRADIGREMAERRGLDESHILK